MPNVENNVSHAGNTCKHVGKSGNNKMFLNLFGNILASWDAIFVSATMFPEVGKQRNIDKKRNVSTTMFPSLPRA